MNFEKGLEPKEAMDVGMSHICKKEWKRELCENCPYADFGWRPQITKSKNYCKLGYWGIPDE